MRSGLPDPLSSLLYPPQKSTLVRQKPWQVVSAKLHGARDPHAIPRHFRPEALKYRLVRTFTGTMPLRGSKFTVSNGVACSIRYGLPWRPNAALLVVRAATVCRRVPSLNWSRLEISRPTLRSPAMAEKIWRKTRETALPSRGGVQPIRDARSVQRKYSVAPLDIVFRTVHGFCAGLSVWQ